MDNSFIKSKTWKKNSAKLEHFQKININDFHNFNVIAGLYQYPSPFIYNKYLTPNFLNKILSKIQKILKLNLINSYKKDLLNLWEELPNDIKKFLPESTKEHESFLSLNHEDRRYKVNGLYIKCSEQAYNLKRHVKSFLNLNILEIGGGYGIMAEIMMKYDVKNYFICDLDETLNLAEMYLKNFTKHEIKRIESIEDLNKLDLNTSSGKIYLCNVENYLAFNKEIIFDIVINSCSFAEMNEEMLNKYLDKISRYSNSVVSCSNRDRLEGNFEYRHNFWFNDKRFNVETIFDYNNVNYPSKNTHIPQYIVRINPVT